MKAVFESGEVMTRKIKLIITASSLLIQVAQDLGFLLFLCVSRCESKDVMRRLISAGFVFFCCSQRSWNAKSGECLAEQTRRLL